MHPICPADLNRSFVQKLSRAIRDVDPSPTHSEGIRPLHPHADLGAAGPLMIVKPSLALQPAVTPTRQNHALEQLPSRSFDDPTAKR